MGKAAPIVVKYVQFGGPFTRQRPTFNVLANLRSQAAVLTPLGSQAESSRRASIRKKPQIRLINVTDCGCWFVCRDGLALVGWATESSLAL